MQNRAGKVDLDVGCKLRRGTAWDIKLTFTAPSRTLVQQYSGASCVRNQGLGFRVEGLGLGFRVWGCF